VAGASVVAHTLAALAGVARLSHTLVVLSPRDREFEQHVPHFAGWIARCGGDTRAATVSAGLAELAARGARPDDWVLVHDAARCLVRPRGSTRSSMPAPTIRSAACSRCRWPTR
jgi:2-C-methyl-D-erythritol 4-phosphate cytidylyltransferase